MTDLRKISRSEKKLFFAVGFSITLILVFAAWRQWRDSLPEAEIPTLKMPSPNAYDFYVKGGLAIIPATTAVDPILEAQPVTGAQGKTRYSLAAKEAWLRQNSTALNLLRQGFKYPFRKPPQRSLFPKVRTFGDFRMIARLLAVESHAYSERGHWKKAADSALDILKIGHDVPKGGLIADYLVGVAINEMGRDELRKVQSHLGIVELKSIVKRLETITQVEVSFADVLTEEKYLGQAAILEIIKTNEWRRENMFGSRGIERLGELWETSTLPRQTILNNYTTYMDFLIDIAKKPYTFKVVRPQFSNDIISNMVKPMYRPTRWIHANDNIENNLLLIELALRACHLENRRYPQTLNELVPRYLKTIPLDAYGGGDPLHYKLARQKYSLYSVGSDGVDNNGRALENFNYPKENRSRFQMTDESKGDFVSGINH